MLLLHMTHDSSCPLYKQIVRGIIAKIESRQLLPGDRLPSTRSLARANGISRLTVLKAYQELWSLGYVESRPGSYTTVRKRLRPAGLGPSRTAESSRPPEEDKRPVPFFSAEKSTSGPVNFRNFFLDPRLFPMDDIRRCANSVLQPRQAALLNYMPPAGYPPLRTALATHMQEYGINVSPDEIIITSGSTQGLKLLSSLLSRPHRPALVESPTYNRFLALLQEEKIPYESIPMERKGCSLSALQKACCSRPSFFYTMPSLHNPTGITTSQKHREEVLSLCEEYGVAVIEDGYDEDMKYFERMVLPIKSMDKGRHVYFAGSFSKSLAPGFRIGWIAVPPAAVLPLTEAKLLSDFSSNSLSQLFLFEMIRRGYLQKHLRRLNRVYSRRMKLFLSLLEEGCSGLPVTFRPPAGGYLVWLALPGLPVPPSSLSGHFLNYGVMVSSGDTFFPRPSRTPFIRLSISLLDEEEILTGTRRFIDGLYSLYERS